MSLHGITGPSVQQARPLTQPNFVALRDKMCEISTVNKFCSPEKQARGHPRSRDLSLEFLQTLCSNFGSRLLCCSDISGFQQTCAHLHVRYMLSPVRLSSVTLMHPTQPISNFWQYFYGVRYLGHLLTSTENFMEIVPLEVPGTPPPGELNTRAWQ